MPGGPGYVAIVEPDPQWAELFEEMLDQAGVPNARLFAPPALSDSIAFLAESSAIVSDWSALHGAPIVGSDLSREAIDVVSSLLAAGFRGPLILVSGAADLLAIKLKLGARFRALRVYSLSKQAADWDVLPELVRSAVEGATVTASGLRSRPADLVANWNDLMAGREDRDGKLLESAVSRLFTSLDFEVVQNVRSVTGEVDIVVRVTSGYSSIFDPRFILIECKNRNSAATVGDVEKLATRMERCGARIGVIVSRRGVSGARKHVDRDAVRAMQDVMVASAGERVIVSLSFEECRDAALGALDLEAVLDRKVFDERMRKR